jgi:hypothetical protein
MNDYWARNCHGFHVETSSGRLGIVENVLYGADPDRPAALAVRGGLFGTRVELVPIEQVADLEPRQKRVTLR